MNQERIFLPEARMGHIRPLSPRRLFTDNETEKD